MCVCVCEQEQKQLKLLQYVKLTQLQLFTIMFSKSGPTYKRQNG